MLHAYSPARTAGSVDACENKLNLSVLCSKVLGSTTRVCFVDDDVICEQFSVTEEIFLLNSADTVKVRMCAC